MRKVAALTPFAFVSVDYLVFGEANYLANRCGQCRKRIRLVATSTKKQIEVHLRCYPLIFEVVQDLI